MTARDVFPYLLVPGALGEAADAGGAPWGVLELRHDIAEHLLVVAGYRVKGAHRKPLEGRLADHHFMQYADDASQGVFHRASPEALALHCGAITRGLMIETDTLKDTVESGWRGMPADQPVPVLCRSTVDGTGYWSAWWVTGPAARPARFAEVTDADPIEGLRDVWPLGALGASSAVVVGAGSIGSSAAESLATAGIGRLTIVDYDRLLQHNLPRHRLTERDLGRYKVTALTEALGNRYPSTDFEPLIADVALDADRMRPVFSSADVVVCAADGVQARRVTNHLARRASTPLVLAAVLEDGAFGEVIRVSPRTGCLWCLRRNLEDDGTFNPEPHFDRGYAAGGGQNPMTAAPPDLRLMGELAAKSALATLLEAKGHFSQKLPGDWAVVGLQPAPLMPPPFDGVRAGGIRWSSMPDRRGDCPTCADP